MDRVPRRVRLVAPTSHRQPNAGAAKSARVVRRTPPLRRHQELHF
jgi:hypothetical protein